MKNKILFVLILVTFLFPYQKVFASGTCSADGYSLLTINGINTDEKGARENKDNLKKILPPTHNNQKITVDFLHNKSHGKIIDALDTTNQIYFDKNSLNIEDSDFTQMLNDASAKLNTQKVLLVSHSQGNFYANTFYDAVADEEGGVPSISIGVYGVATPSSRVAGGGLYLTSDTDKMIAGTVAQFPLIDILKPNTHINFQISDGDSLGHSFSKIYLAYEGGRIISDIKTSLDKLQNNNIQKEDAPCISPLKLTLTQKIQGTVLAIVDPISIPLQESIVYVSVGSYKIATAFGNGVLNGVNSLASAISSLSQSFFGNNKTLAVNNTAAVINATNNTNFTVTESVLQNSTEIISFPQKTTKENPKPTIQATPEATEEIPPYTVPTQTSQNTQATPATGIVFSPPVPSVVVVGTSSVPFQLEETLPEEDFIAPEPEPEPEPEPADTTSPNIPTITTTSHAVNTDSISITGTAEIDSIVTITGGESEANGVATDGNYSIAVPLNKNTVNTLNVTAADASNNTSDSVSILITHDNIPPVLTPINSGSNGFVRVVVVGGSFFLIVSADASYYVDGGSTINGVPISSLSRYGNNHYDFFHTVTLGEPDRLSGATPISIVLTDEAGNSNEPYTLSSSFFIPTINGHEPASVTQVFPTFTSDGKFTEDVYLPCVSNSGYFQMYYEKDSDLKFNPIKYYSASLSVVCPGGQMKTEMTSGRGFEDFSYPAGYYKPVEGWYYGIVSIDNLTCGMAQANHICDARKKIQSFFRLHRDADGVWSDSVD